MGIYIPPNYRPVLETAHLKPEKEKRKQSTPADTSMLAAAPLGVCAVLVRTDARNMAVASFPLFKVRPPPPRAPFICFSWAWLFPETAYLLSRVTAAGVIAFLGLRRGLFHQSLYFPVQYFSSPPPPPSPPTTFLQL